MGARAFVWVLVVCLAVAPTLRADAAPMAEDAITTAVLHDDGTTREIALRPFQPASRLTAELGQLPEPNRSIVRTLLEYPRDGTHDYWWPKGAQASAYDGATTDVVVGGNRLLRGEPRARSFCCGLTLEVLYRALADLPAFQSRATPEWSARFKSLWFCRALFSPGPGEALVDAGMGVAITDPKTVMPGDFVQIWRHDKTGHSVVFVGWAYDAAGRAVGIHYWSTQPRTDGIGFATELFGRDGKSVDLSRTGFARLLSPEKWTGR